MSSRKNNSLRYTTAGDAGLLSGSEASDASWVVTPSGKDKASSGSHSSSAFRQQNEGYRLSNSTAISASASSPTKIRRHHRATDSPSNLESSTLQSSSASRSRNVLATPVTPSKGSAASVSTPSSRLTAIENALEELRLDNASPTSSKLTGSATVSQIGLSRRRLVVISDSESDSDSDDSLTDNYISTSQAPPPMTSDFSKSSMSSLFSQRAGASSTSPLDIAPLDSASKPLAKPAEPAVLEDMFSPTSSPNVTTCKEQRAELSAPITAHASQSPVTPREPVPASITKLARSHLGVDLEVAFIAHDDGVQQLMDFHRIEWGTQYELARGVSQGWWSWTDVRGHLNEFQGKNADVAFTVQSVMQHKKGGASSLSDSELWKELDREQLAIMENCGRGLGLMGDWKGSRNWYGGRIQQLARLVKDGSSYRIKLEPMEKRRSYRFARMFGSRRFIHLKITEEALQKENAQVKRFLLKKFILCGRTYIPFTSKEGAVYLFETDEDHRRSTQHWCGDQFRISLQTFINWHNPLEQPENYKQIISKWATRFVLGLSNSVPAIEFDEKNIFFINDIVASDWNEDGKPPAHKLMTDGCGFINSVALLQIVQRMGYKHMPAGIQGRIGGSKGFWILHPTDKSKEPKIWIRDSQNKIKHHSFDRAHRIFDLLGPSRPSPSIALTSQSIINLFANGTPSETLVRLMEEGLDKEVAPLLDWDRHHAPVFLWHAINKAGNVAGSRTQRIANALSRALGLKGREWRTVESETGEDMDLENVDSSANTGRNKHSGAPASLYELTMEMIQSGFLPDKNQYLYEKMGYVVEVAISSSVEKFRIPIEESLGAYIVPDPTGVLEEGEIYYHFSEARTDPKTGLLIHYLEGDVLLGRYPIRLPSDMRKMKAVYKRELRDHHDVIIVSTKGKRSAASELADGDMDGDEVIVIFNEEIVQSFNNKPFTEAPDDLISANFEPSGKLETVEKFCIRVEALSPRQTSEALVEHLIAHLNDSQIGLYSMMHENATVTYGYGHKESIRLAYIFATLLDSSKTGHRLKAGILQKDLDRFGKKFSHSNGHLLPNDILGHLKRAGKRKGKDLHKEYKSKKKPAMNILPRDKELLLPYDAASVYANEASDHKNMVVSEELKRIRDHVDVAYEMFKVATSRGHSNAQTPYPPSKPSKKRKSSQKDLMLACSQAYAQPLEDGIVFIRDLEQVKASYAYRLSEIFGFAVAFNRLCHIKAVIASGGHAPTLRIFDQAKTISLAFLRALSCFDEYWETEANLPMSQDLSLDASR